MTKTCFDKNLKTSVCLGADNSGILREGGGQAVLVANPLLFVRNFCIKSCIVCPSG